MTKLTDLKQRLSKNPEFAAEYVKADEEYAVIEALIAALDMQSTIPMDALAYKFDIVLRGRRSTLFENRLEGN